MGDDAKLQEIQKLGGTAIKPVGWDRTGWEAFQYMLWNPDTGEVLTRTPLSWLKITVFYCIYYSCLAGFWIACMNIFFATLPENMDGPKWQQADSIIGVNPGRDLDQAAWQGNACPPPNSSPSNRLSAVLCIVGWLLLHGTFPPLRSYESTD